MADLQQTFETALRKRAEELASGLGFIIGDAVGADSAEFALKSVTRVSAGESPADLAGPGTLLIQVGRLKAPRDDRFALGWFLSGEPSSRLVAAGAEKSTGLAKELIDQLATDKYDLESAEAAHPDDRWADFAGRNEPDSFWRTDFEVTGVGAAADTVSLVWPVSTLERMFGPSDLVSERQARTGATAPAAASAAPPAAPAEEEDPRQALIRQIGIERINRIIRTKVPVAVTLASRLMRASRLMELAPGSVLEFDRNCDEPLVFTVNNLPIGEGEAVKVGEKFGIKMSKLAAPAERFARSCEKRKYA
jgi:flagellar motor switch/type III secretory pathway protein FliN